MRISDWSSDVCSSDLLGRGLLALRPVLQEDDHVAGVHFLAGAPAPGHARVVAADRAALAHPLGEDLLDLPHLADGVEIGRASCRARVFHDVSLSVDADSLTQHK